MSDHTRFRLAQMENALRKRGLTDIVLDDDRPVTEDKNYDAAATKYWLDAMTESNQLRVRWTDDRFEIDVYTIEGKLDFQVQHADLDEILNVLSEKGILPKGN